MRSVLFLNRVYPPEVGATGQLLAELAPQLAQEGWQVTVLTSQPTEGAARSERVAGVRVERVRGLFFSRVCHWKRALSYLVLYPALLWRALRLPRADVIVTMTDPPLHLVLGPMLGWVKGSRLVHWAQDLYPELAEELGVLCKGGCLAGLCRRLSTWGLRRHDAIIAVGDCMKQRLLERGLAETAIRVIPNWAPELSIRPIDPAANPFRAQQGLSDKFVVMYSGNLGLAHPFAAILAAAESLQSSHPEITFVFVGHGPRLPWVKDQVERRRLTNVRFLAPQPLEALADSLSAADVHLASMLENLCGLVVPSKVYGILAAGRPCVFLGPRESEAAQIILEHQCGDVLASAEGQNLARCLVRWREDRARYEAASQRAERTAAHHGLDQVVRAFSEALQPLYESETATLTSLINTGLQPGGKRAEMASRF
jgi:colanic acid biosynthesis glycosyl transferase WcaI